MRFGYLRTLWQLTLPSIVALGLYSAVFVEARYVAPFCGILATCALATSWNRLAPAWKKTAAISGAILCGVALGFPAALSIQTVTRTEPRPPPNLAGEIARDLQARGVGPGATVGFIGYSESAYAVRLAGARIVCEIPIEFLRNDDIDNSLLPGMQQIEEFWGAPLEERKKILAAMRKAGAVAVLADNLPAWADLTGWEELAPRTMIEPLKARMFIYRFEGQ
jgi:hypothetical protein